MKIIIFGTGRVGHNMKDYFKSLDHNVISISHGRWQDNKDDVLSTFQNADIIALAVPDDKIATLYETLRPKLNGATVIHFSGAQSYDSILGYHPLYSFPAKSVAIKTLASIAFAREKNTPPFAKIIPGIKNPEIAISKEDRALYHALAVLSGNFSAHLWNKSASLFEDHFKSPAAPIFKLYFQSLIDRFEESPRDSLTGPLARKDRLSVANNLQALNNHPELTLLYRAFLTSAWPDHEES